MKTDGLFETTTKTISKEISLGGYTVLKEALRYPGFDTENEKFGKVCARMNAFYKSGAEKYDRFAQKTLSKKAFSQFRKTGRIMTTSMNYNISFCDEDYICVITDISGCDGQGAFGTRIAHTWSVESACILPVSHFIKTDRKSISHIKNTVIETVRKNSSNPAFGYYGDCEKRARQAFSISNYCLLPKGLAFFIDPGVLSDAKYGPSVFVINTQTAIDKHGKM